MFIFFEAPPASTNNTAQKSPSKPNTLTAFTISLLFCLSFLTTCSDGEAPADRSLPGTITITATHDCDFRIFDSQGRQVAKDTYELGRPPTIVNVKYTGLFVIKAKNAEGKELTDPIPYPGGHIQYYIEF